MRAVIIDEPGRMRVAEVPMPERKVDEALIRVMECGICGSDVSAFKGTSPTVRYPILLGHEVAGVIEEIGENDRGLSVGDRVIIEPFCFCGECEICRQGRYNDCPSLFTRGVQIPGTMTEYITHKVSLIHKAPDNITDEQLVMAEPLTIALHGLHRVGLKQGETCLVTGAGTIGILAALAAQSYGARVLLVDPFDERLQLAKQMGVAYTFNNGEGDLLEYLKTFTGGWLPHVIAECSGAVPMVEKLTDYISYGGRIVFVGWPKSTVNFSTILVSRKELDLFGSRNSKDCFPEALSLISSGKIPVEQLVSAVVPMEECGDIFEKLIHQSDRYIKAIIKCG